MPLNASIEYGAAVEEYERAKTFSEKLIALQKMKSEAPTHKGGEKLRAEISRKIAALKEDIDKQKQQAKKATGHSIAVRKDGDGQVVLIGLPSTGKSTLLNALTHTDTPVGAYGFTTKKPVIGSMNFTGANVQLVEIPALMEGSSKGKANGTQMLSIVRNADAIVILASALEEYTTIVNELKNVNIVLNRKKPKIEIRVAEFPGITISGKQYLKISHEALKQFLKSLGMHHASVVLHEDATIEKLSEVMDTRIVYKKALIVSKTISSVHALQELSNNKVMHFNALSKDKEALNPIKEAIFGMLGKILVYTKRPGTEVDYSEPLVLKEGATIEDAATLLHKEFAQKLKFARLWGSAKHPGMRVPKGYKLENKDIVEINA